MVCHIHAHSLAFRYFVPQNDILSQHGSGVGLLVLLVVGGAARGVWP